VLDHFIPEIGDYTIKAMDMLIPRRTSAGSLN
jgi:hypothetical protein